MDKIAAFSKLKNDMKILTIVLIVALVAIQSCVQLREGVEVDYDEFDEKTTIVGIEQDSWEHSEDVIQYQGNPSKHFIRTFVKPDIVSHQLYIVAYYRGDWRFYRRAEAKADDELDDFVQINRDVVDGCSYGCIYREDWAISISDNFLQHNKEGFKIKSYAKSGHEHVIKVTAEQIKAQLEALKEL